MDDCAVVEFRTTVRELVEFVHRTGNLVGEGGFKAANRAAEGTRGHRRVQKARGEDYRSEIPVERIFETGGARLVLTGRVDGLIESRSPVLVEEIKTVDEHWSGVSDPVHLAQLQIYAALLAESHGWQEVEMRLTYVELESGTESHFTEVWPAEKLGAFLNETVEEWLAWLIPQAEWLRRRNRAASTTGFPLAPFRPGQHELASAVYRSVRDGKNLFAEAPTGLGKTIATLYPALKALPLLGEGKIFYVTAKTPGRLAATSAIEKLRLEGGLVRSVTLTAKAKICFGEIAGRCDARVCPFAVGYHDRIKEAVRDLLKTDQMDRAAIERVARKHQVCPFELSLDAALWCDVIVGDFNHVFDPTARLQRFFSDGPARHLVLVDEAHNLLERSRDIYSAAIRVDDLEMRGPARGRGASKARAALRHAQEAVEAFLVAAMETAPALESRDYHESAKAFETLPADLVQSLREAARALEVFLASRKPGENVEGWIEPWFVLSGFLRAAEAFDATCRVIAAPREKRVSLYCADPSGRLRETLLGLRATIFFSATLSPMNYFRDLLGGDSGDRCLAFRSPYDPGQMRLSICALDVSFKGRSGSLKAVAAAVTGHIRQSRGNHLIFCPSMDYLARLEIELGEIGGVSLFAQHSGMDEAARNAFLNRFVPGANQVGLAVLGGIFSEGIDLPGERLGAVTVIGVGMPRLSLERDILLAHFQAARGDGFDCAYRFPGMQRVLQAVGRLIRSETDHGSALLIDRRFFEPRYRRLFPTWWQPGGVRQEKENGSISPPK